MTNIRIVRGKDGLHLGGPGELETPTPIRPARAS